MTEPQVFRRVETVEAMQYDGHNYDQIVEWMGTAVLSAGAPDERGGFHITTPRGECHLLPSYWLIEIEADYFITASDETLNSTYEKVPVRIETFADKAGEFRWRVVHNSNGETMGDSGEGYVNKSDRDHAVNLLWSGVPIREV